MGIAALILGIMSLIVGFMPFCGVIAFIPAIVGLILGIVDTVQKSNKKEKKGMSIAGIVLNGIAIVCISFWILVAGALVSTADLNEIDNSIQNLSTSLNEYYSTTHNN